MARSEEDFENATTNINAVTFAYNLADSKRTALVGVCRKFFGQRFPVQSLLQFICYFIGWADNRAELFELLIIAVNHVKEMIAADMVIVSVRVEDDDVQISQLINDTTHVADTEPGIE